MKKGFSKQQEKENKQYIRCPRSSDCRHLSRIVSRPAENSTRFSQHQRRKKSGRRENYADKSYSLEMKDNGIPKQTRAGRIYPQCICPIRNSKRSLQIILCWNLQNSMVKVIILTNPKSSNIVNKVYIAFIVQYEQ